MAIMSMFKSPDYIGAAEFNGKSPTLTIARVRSVDLEDEKGRTSGKPVVYFREVKRGWVLCKTSAFCLQAMFGPDESNWQGKRVTIYATNVKLGPETVPGIRVLGSPDIAKVITFTLRLPRKKPVQITLKPTPKGQIVAPEEPKEVADEPAPEAVSDAPPDDVPGWGGEAPEVEP